MPSISEQSPQLSAKTWWGQRRLRYNLALTKAGLLAFGCYLAVVFWGSSTGAMPDADINLVTTIFQGVAWLLTVIIANLCYSLGSLAERLIKPENVQNYRRITFTLGFWFSVILPFSVPVFLAWVCLNGKYLEAEGIIFANCVPRPC